MRISVVVPSFNYVDYIGACIQSIQMQSYDNYEVLIADGGSTDGSLDIITNICNQDKRCRLVSIGDNGQPDAIVKAYSFATGDIFCFLNADDCFICSDALSSVASSFEVYKDVHVISFRGYYIDAKGKYLKPVRLRYHPLDSIKWMKFRTAVLQPATFWRRHVYESTPILIDYHYVFDAIFFYQIFMKFSWLELCKPIAGHRLHGSNKSLQINFARVRELAKFEEIKFGQHSFRSNYLLIIAALIYMGNRIPIFGKMINRGIYFLVNSISFFSFYRMPSI